MAAAAAMEAAREDTGVAATSSSPSMYNSTNAEHHECHSYQTSSIFKTIAFVVKSSFVQICPAKNKMKKKIRIKTKGLKIGR